MAREVPLINKVDTRELDNEWRPIPWDPFHEEIQYFLHDPNEFYDHIMQITGPTGKPQFAHLAKLVFQVPSFPTCNADAKRFFCKA